jgi:RNA polymerase sigma-70 factor (ECF subfamily)
VTALLSQQARAERAFERIYRRHVGDVYRYALAVLRNPADAEDVAQTTFLNAYRAYVQGERPRNPQNWLISIAHNVCRQRFRQALRRPDEVAYNDDLGDRANDDEDRPSAQDIRRALGHLAFNQRAALVMRELEGRSYTEIAEILETSVSAVETLIFRARRALREQLEASLTCGEAERAISRELDGRLSRGEKGALRAHLRACRECERFARSHRAQRRAIRSLAAVPIPSSLTSLFGGGGGSAVAVGGGVATKAAAVVAAGTVATGVGYEGVKRLQVVRPAAPDPVAETAPRARARAVGADPSIAAPALGVPLTTNLRAKAAKARATKPQAPPGRAKHALRPAKRRAAAKPAKPRREHRAVVRRVPPSAPAASQRATRRRSIVAKPVRAARPKAASKLTGKRAVKPRARGQRP